MCGNNMSVPLLAEAVTLPGTEKETAVVRVKLFSKPNSMWFSVIRR